MLFWVDKILIWVYNIYMKLTKETNMTLTTIKISDDKTVGVLNSSSTGRWGMMVNMNGLNYIVMNSNLKPMVWGKKKVVDFMISSLEAGNSVNDWIKDNLIIPMVV